MLKQSSLATLRSHLGFLDRMLVVMMLVFGFTASQGQTVSQYTFSSPVTTFTDITSGGNTVAGFPTNSWDDVISSSAVALGFNFNFKGTTYSDCYVSSNGFITFGTNTPSSTDYFPISSTDNYDGAISAFGEDIGGTTGAANRVRTLTTGSSPNRVFIVEWPAAHRFNGTTAVSGDDLDIELRLSETTNTIDLVYNNFTITSTTAFTCQVGLRGSANTDFNNRTTTTNWSGTTAGGSNSASCTTKSTVKPANNLCFRFTPPAPSCIASPTSPASGGTVCQGTQTLTWPAAAWATGYDVYFNTGATATTLVSTNQSTTSYTTSSLAAGAYAWKVFPRNGTGTASGCTSWTFTVNGTPTTPNAGPDFSVCSSAATATMAGNTITTGTGTWTQTNGTAATITTPGSPTTTITGLTTTGTRTFRWSAANSPCTTLTDDVIITVVAPPSAAAAGVDQTICATSGSATMAATAPGTGTGGWTQVGGPTTATITTPSSRITTITAMTTAGTYTFRWTVANAPCTATTDDVDIFVNPAPTTSAAGPDQNICVSAPTATMAGNAAGIGTGTWTQVSGPSTATIVTPGSPTTVINALSTVGTYVFQWSIANAPCVASVDQISVFVKGIPTTAAANIDQTICATSGSATMAGNTATSGAGVWSQVSGPVTATITTPASPTTTITGMTTAGTYTYQWTISNAPCTATSDQMSVFVNPAPTTSAAGPDQNICVSAPTATMAGNTATIGTGTWTQVSGPSTATIVTPGSPTTVINALSAVGTYVFQWTIVNTPCTNSIDQISVFVKAVPSAAAAGPDQNICATSGSATMNATNPTAGTGAWTQVSGPSTATITTPSSRTTTITAMTSVGTYTFRWTVSNAPCTSTTDDVDIVTTPGTSTAVAGTDQTICVTTPTATMAATAAVNGTGTWTQVSGPSTATIVTAGSPTTVINALSSVGTYVFQWTITNAPCATTNDQISVIVKALPSAAAAGPDQNICATAGSATMNATNPASGTGAWTQVSGPSTATITTPSSRTTTITAMTAVGTYTFRWTVSNAPCTATTDDIDVVTTPGTTASNAGPDQGICYNVTATLAANIPTNGVGVWSILGTSPNTSTAQLSSTTANNAVFTPSTSGTYTLRWTINNSPCASSTDDVVITVNPFAFPVAQTFNANGTFNVPAGVSQVTVQAWGGGGSGGGSTTPSGITGRGGAGGGGGAYVSKLLTVTPGSTLNVTVGGAVNGTSGANGSNGNPSTIVGFEAQVFAAAGSAGAGNITGNTPAGGAGGTVAASQGDTKIAGVTGENGATGIGISSGDGGTGGNGGGTGGAGVGSGSANGGAGSAPGGGGGGGRTSIGGSANTGGTGAAGRVIITYTSIASLTATATTICNGSSTTLTATGGGTYLWSPGGATTPSITVSPSTTTTYSVTVTNTCTATLTQQIVVNPKPTASVSGGGTVCAGSTLPNVIFTFTGTAPYNFTYNPGGVSVTGHMTNTYTITGAAAGAYSVTALTDVNCTATSLGGIANVVVNPLPTASTSGGGTVCVGSTLPNVVFTFTGTAPYNFTYNPGGVSVTGHMTNTYTITGAAAGAYSVTALTDANCTATSLGGTASVVVNPLPTASVNGGGTVCSTDPLPNVVFSFTGTAPYNFTYNPGGVSVTGHMTNTYTITGAAAGTYSVTALTDANCTATDLGGTASVVVNTATTWYQDTDGDGAGDPAVNQMACAQPVGYVSNDNDGCPTDGNKIAPGACGCGTADVATTYYVDTDGDGFGDPNSSIGGYTCIVPEGYVANNTDLCPTDGDKQAPGQCGCGVADTDSDGDGTADCVDGCADDPDKIAPGICGCNTPDTDTDNDGLADCIDPCPDNNANTDTDGDGTYDCFDNCPNDANKVNPGQCGCGVADTDSDADGYADCVDACPNDPNKIAPGVCGCGVSEADTDGDGTPDCNDACPIDPLKTAPGLCGCGVVDTDTDGDATPDCFDACPSDPNKTAPGICGCGVPDTDTDGDGTPDCIDGCPNIAFSNGLVLDMTTDNDGGQTSWKIITLEGGSTVASGTGFNNNSVSSSSVCLPNGDYRLIVLDSNGDGMCCMNGNGGYVLRTSDGRRIIDAHLATFTDSSSVVNGFHLPLGPDRLTAYNCDRENLLPSDFIQCMASNDVRAQYGIGNQSDDGYQFWIFNPNGGYSRRLLITHSTASYLFPVGADRCTYFKLNSLSSNPLPFNVSLNVRIRSQVNGVYSQFGPACRIRIDLTNQCPTTSLIAADCGLTGVMLNNTRTLHATPVAGATKYQFEFVKTSGPAPMPYTRKIASAGSTLVLSKWASLPLQYGCSYTVRVRVSFDDGQTYCPFGTSCTMTTAPSAQQMVMNQNAVEAEQDEVMNMWPNPNHNEPMHITIQGFDDAMTRVNVNVVDLFGKKVFDQDIEVEGETLNTTLDLRNKVAAGIYLVNVTANGHTWTKRVVME